MTKKKALVNENVIRRWGKLANMAPLTENFIDTLDEEEDDMEAGEPDMEADAGEMDMGDEPAEAGEEEAVERIVSAVVDAISQETGVDIEVEGEAGEAGEMEMDVDMGDDAAMMDDDPAMRDHGNMPANRDDDLHERGNPPPPQKDDDDDDDEEHDRKKKVKKEELDLEVIDDEELTEAVLVRVVERLLRRK
jgi:hypothetical protein